MITLDDLVNDKRLSRKGVSFAASYHIYRYKTKIEFLYDAIGSVRVYVHQSDDDSNSFNNTILFGMVRTLDELDSIYKQFLRE